MTPTDPAPKIPLTRIVLPAEHGSWAFLGEPLLLGLLVAPSPGGAWLALAAAAGFLARQPLKLLAGDRRRGRRYARTVLAERAFTVLAIVAVAALAASVATSRGSVLFAVGLAAPLAASALALDLGQRARDAAAETAAALGLGGVAAGIVLAAGGPRPLAFALWALVAARAVPTILFVRARLRLDRGQRASVTGPLLLHLAAIAAAVALVRVHLAPTLAISALGVLALRAAYGLSPWRPRVKPMVLGIGEVVLGLSYVAALAMGFRALR